MVRHGGHAIRRVDFGEREALSAPRFFPHRGRYAKSTDVRPWARTVFIRGIQASAGFALSPIARSPLDLSCQRYWKMSKRRHPQLLVCDSLTRFQKGFNQSPVFRSTSQTRCAANGGSILQRILKGMRLGFRHGTMSNKSTHILARFKTRLQFCQIRPLKIWFRRDWNWANRT